MAKYLETFSSTISILKPIRSIISVLMRKTTFQEQSLRTSTQFCRKQLKTHMKK